MAASFYFGEFFAGGFFDGGGVVVIPPSGGFLSYQSRRRKTSKEIREEREEFGIVSEETIAKLIADLAEKQADETEQDAKERRDELRRELALENIEWNNRYLEELNKRREQIIMRERLNAETMDHFEREANAEVGLVREEARLVLQQMLQGQARAFPQQAAQVIAVLQQLRLLLSKVQLERNGTAQKKRDAQAKVDEKEAIKAKYRAFTDAIHARIAEMTARIGKK